ncbi:MAG: Arm DNA-binding domain-containing protein [Deltaproteobacteria bacterium]|nr:Arm DNA-binding domain-containing protein [Deltaproteobacteria bacterium]
MIPEVVTSSASTSAALWDDKLPGFGVRVYPSGSKIYVVQTRMKGRSRRVTIGRHGVISADRARRQAAETIARIKSGGEPTQTAPGALTVAELAARYLEEHVEVRCKPNTRKMYKSVVERFILPPTVMLRWRRWSSSTSRSCIWTCATFRIRRTGRWRSGASCSTWLFHAGRWAGGQPANYWQTV